jgi:tetratricopeptide (TPR) repeat protein
VAHRLLVDLGADGRVKVISWPEGRPPDPVACSPLEWPLDDAALEDLRWYLEDYLRAPFGVYEDRGPRVREGLAGWGEAVFAAVFGSGLAKDAYVRARSAGAELVFRSASVRHLGLPWELMQDQSGPVALSLAGVNRSLPTAELAETVPMPGGRLRVLIVISRPEGLADVGYRMIARPLLERLDAVRGEVDLVVLRPPTLDALRDTLADAVAEGEPFHVVHFDGHGTLGADSEGLLVLEGRSPIGHAVSASRIAAVLNGGRVPVAVLNACWSGAVGKELEAAIATALLRGGATSVVAMAYRIYAVAAAEFMAAFYEELFAGGTVSAAVTAGRRRLYVSDQRPSPQGEMPLADWLVPVHYMRHDVSFPQARASRPVGTASLEVILDRLREPGINEDAEAGSLDSAGSFVGRDDLFYQIETAAQRQRVIVLHGPGGTGKTELAKAFGRWWRDTKGVDQPDWVLWHSFEPGPTSFGRDGLIAEIGLQTLGADFAKMEADEQQTEVEDLLARRRLLLIWDNFETVSSMPDPTGATPPQDQAGCQELNDFVNWLSRHGRSTLIITSRTAEDWLGPICRIPVVGLTHEEAAEYAGKLLAPYPAAAPRRAQRQFGELLEWLDGHPLSMRLILPHLADIDPGALLDGLRGTRPLPGDSSRAGRMTSLAASITYSFAHLTAQTRRLLPAICLCYGVAATKILAGFSQVSGCPYRFAGTKTQEWREALDDAARVGLLTALGDGMYRIHPALPSYLAALWKTEDPEDHDSVRDAATRALVAACANFAGTLREEIESGYAGHAYGIIGLQRHALSAMLGHALEHQLWEQARAIAWPLDRYWDARGLDEEAAAWTSRVQYATQVADGVPPGLGSAAGALWLFMTGSLANRQLRAKHIDYAERAHRQILAMLQAQPESPQQQSRIATAYHMLGAVAQYRGQPDEAETWFRKALAITESSQESTNRHHTAASYQHLGIVAQRQGRLEEAEAWYHKSLAIEEELGDKPGMAHSYGQLGILAQERGQPAKAQEWHLKALPIFMELGDRPRLATSYLHLGDLARDQEELDQAEAQYLRSLAIFNELRDQHRISANYHHLGVLAQDRGRLEEAEEWHRKCLDIEEELGDQDSLAESYKQLALLAEQQGHDHQALTWTIRQVRLLGDFATKPLTGLGPSQLARLTTRLGMEALEACWHEVTGSQLPPVIRDYVHTHQPEQKTEG